jgi:hypothetical protein
MNSTDDIFFLKVYKQLACANRSVVILFNLLLNDKDIKTIQLYIRGIYYPGLFAQVFMAAGYGMEI